jgi:hypothetical protein
MGQQNSISPNENNLESPHSSMTLRSFLAFLSCSLTQVLPSQAQESARIVINTNNDGVGSLRQAIRDTETEGSITFATTLNGQAISLDGEQIDLKKSITIDASALSEGLTIDANTSDDSRNRIFEVRAATHVSLLNLTLINGFTANGEDGLQSTSDSSGEDASGGGAILNRGTLALTRCTLSNNQGGDGGNGGFGRGGVGGFGGAILNTRDLTLTDCTFFNNSGGDGGIGGNGEGGFGFGSRGGAGGNGGAIANSSSGILTVTACTFSGNQAGSGRRGGDGVNFGGNGGTGGSGGIGGAIANKGILTLRNCTLMANQSGTGGDGGNANLQNGANGGHGGDGGAIANSSGSSLNLTHCTLTGNQTNQGGLGGFESDEVDRSGDPGKVGKGGGIHNSGTANLTNTIVSANVGSATSDVEGSITEEGSNLLTSDFPVLLRPLGDYGGPTYTMPPLLNSPALDSATSTESMTSDQRGFSRLADGNGDGTSAPDIGAVEHQTPKDEFDLLFALDSDGDGLNTIEELVIGTDPRVSDNTGASNLSLANFDTTTGVPSFALSYRDSEFRLRITRSSDLLNFSNVIADSDTTADFVASSGDSPLELKDETPLTTGRAFYRLEIVRPE